tara:strand:+ start:1089 stop:2819 length:1731 start_codon:yes stop_codon:yes gene_type:complete
MTCCLIAKDQLDGTLRRSSKDVMKLDRLGALFPNRLSFSRTLVRRMRREKWTIKRNSFSLNEKGVGTAIYKITTNQSPLWFVVFAQHLLAEDRTDRVIAEKWDATFTLTCEEPIGNHLKRLEANVPLQEMGRYTAKELVLSRANKSVRLFEYVSDKLAAGVQPDPSELMDVGYLIRTTAVYGNGKFGLSDLENIKSKKIFELPFQAEMLCVYLARCFSFDWVEHVAFFKSSGSYKPLDDHLKQALGVGNATGLGMAPFLVNHPKLICHWITARENALAAVKGIKKLSKDSRNRFVELLKEAQIHLIEWPTTDEKQQAKLQKLKEELLQVAQRVPSLDDYKFWESLTSWASSNLSLEGQELLNSLVIEINPTVVDHFELETASDELMVIEADMPLISILKIIESRYSWVLKLNLEHEESNARFWYRSEEKEEPRLGWRFKEPGSDKEMRLGIAQNVKKLYEQLLAEDLSLEVMTVSDFLITAPTWRETIQRIQSLRNCHYAEIEDNVLEENCRPTNLLRCKLAMFGATKFDPKSDLWIRIALFQGAPLSKNLNLNGPDWSSFSPLNKKLSHEPNHFA